MKSGSHEQLKAHYQRLRQMSCEQLWSEEVPAFDRASPSERIKGVSVIRAVGVVFSETGTAEQKQNARGWLRRLLGDPEEKVRRYAMTALPKLEAGVTEERELLGLLGKAATAREDRLLVQTLGRIGGSETLKAQQVRGGGSLAPAVQKLRANVARREHPGSLDLSSVLSDVREVSVVLECREGLEPMLLQEIAESEPLAGVFRIGETGRGWLELRAQKSFSLGDLYRLRCFSTLVFPLGALPALPRAGAPLDARAISGVLASGLTRRLMGAFTQGVPRYRLEFSSRRADPAFVKETTDRVFAQFPEMLNDSREALWEVRIQEGRSGVWIDLRPRVRPDPRFAYRQGDVPAASHPPLAAAMARIAGVGKQGGEKIWDPFCGSGLELAECVLRGGVEEVFGTDLNPEAVKVAEANVEAAGRGQSAIGRHFVVTDFREAGRVAGLRDLSLIITNPPLGKRVPIRDLSAMIGATFELAARLLRPGGRLVLVNPLNLKPSGGVLELLYRQKVDLGFAHFHIEKYGKK